MEKYFNDKRILITGAASGIGRELSLCLAKYKSRLFLVDVQKEALAKTTDECQKLGTEAKSFIVDVTDPTQFNPIKDALKGESMDIVFANAGIGGLNPGHAFSPEIDKRIISINYLGMVNTFAPFIPDMLKKKSGHLIGVSSLASIRGLPGGASYSASKAAQNNCLESLRLDLKSYGIAVTTILPGFVKTRMTQHAEFDMPFMVPVDKAVNTILCAVSRRKSICAFPWQMKYLTFMNRLMPNCLYDFIMPKVAGDTSDKKPRIF